MWLLIVFPIGYINKKNICLIRVHLAVAGDVFNGVLFCAIIIPTICLG